MTDVRAVFTDALLKASCQIVGGVAPGRKGYGEHLADTVLSLPGIAIVALPEADSTRYEGDEHEPMDRLAWTAGGWAASVWEYPEVQLSGRCNDGFWQTYEPVTIAEARALAAAPLAAANAAERQADDSK